MRSIGNFCNIPVDRYSVVTYDGIVCQVLAEDYETGEGYGFKFPQEGSRLFGFMDKFIEAAREMECEVISWHDKNQKVTVSSRYTERIYQDL